MYGDLLYPDTLPKTLEDVDTAYYFVHCMGNREQFEELDREAAHNFSEAARTAGVKRIIYLGGLTQGAFQSSHLRSRLEVGRILRKSGVPTIEFRASIIIGSGSLPFEIIRTLVDRLPFMVTGKWLRFATQPIAVENVIQYLLEAAEVPLEGSAVFEIGGADIVSYEDILREYARHQKLRRIIIPIPLFTPKMGSYGLALVAPRYFNVGRQLVSSVKGDCVLLDQSTLEVFSVRPMGLPEAISKALSELPPVKDPLYCTALGGRKKISTRCHKTSDGHNLVTINE